MDANHTVICWPVVDHLPSLELGCQLAMMDQHFQRTPQRGFLLDDEPDGQQQSALQQWSIIGTVKYIDSKHYSVPEGKAVIELVSGAPSVVLTSAALTVGSTYTLEFMMGDANDSCVGDFTVYAQVGMTIWNFTMRSNGSGTAQNHSLRFKAEIILNCISFASFNGTQTSDNLFCGPVIDNVILHHSYGVRPKLHIGVLISNLVLTLKTLWIVLQLCRSLFYM
ncbi:unnamed protein product [Ilex paraguariensis]|uniref:DUF642 domain-containing protein n=1 Tax=Ilex paraguariensis TaxID=185542 RepID=A0ABC8RH61_9AQUA